VEKKAKRPAGLNQQLINTFMDWLWNLTASPEVILQHRNSNK